MMKWSYRLGKVAGIDVNIHVTFTLLIAWVLLTHWFTGQTLGAALSGLAFVIAIFGCVLLHELGHALAARRFGIGTRDITLLPIGGVARLERMPEKPLQELWVALAGPAVNLLIAVVLSVWLVMNNQLVPLNQLGVVTGPFIERLLVVNVLLIVFNMIPAFPMDGGRCVRALLALRLEYAQATRIAAGVGQVIAVGFVVLGLFSNPFLLLIGVFVWLGAAQEARYATIKAALRGVPVQRALLRDLPILSPTDSLARAVDAFMTSPLPKAVVVEQGKIVGAVSALDLVAHLQRYDPTTPVAGVMQRNIQALELPATLDGALTRLHEARATLMPVVSQGRFVGVITMDQLNQFVALQTALQRYTERAAGADPGSILTARPVSVGE
jgi:Zn-dependent protease/CBS domain-containing protein